MKDYSKYKLNTLPSPKDIRDWKTSAIYPKVALPEVVDYRIMMFPIRDQGTQGACAAMSGSAMKEWQERIDVNMNDYMSPQFIYNCRENPAEEGMYMRNLMEVLKEKGDCMEPMFLYGTKGLPSVETLMSASPYKISNYASIDTINDLKISLYSNGPCIIAVPVYNYTERLWFKNPGEYLLGGHAMCVVGYNKEGFIIRNSWGSDWGQAGYCIMSYEDFGLQWELWTTVDSKSFDPPVPPEPTPPKPDPPVPPIPKKKCWLLRLFGF